MPAQGEYLGMPVYIDDLDSESRAFFKHCASHQLHLQACNECNLLRYPPTTACPWCACLESTWKPVEGRGTLYSYGEVHHAIQPAFRNHTPYMIMLVELDTQKGVPSEHEALRIMGNLATAGGDLAPPEMVRQVGIGSRLRIVYKDIGEELSQPLWMLDETAEQPAQPWRYAIE